MSRLVMKFGGTSVANIERIRSVALRVKREVDSGRQVAVVVSAMSGKTNELVGWCKELSALHDWREYDLVVSSGELVTSGLLAIALQTLGVPARSWAGWQLPIRTTDMHGSAAIKEVVTDKLIASLDKGEVAVIAGFQGLAADDRISTLGRGGSDTSAVAVAAALMAERCDIYTDVDGVYTTDPRIVPRAKKIPKIAYEEMLELASVGARESLMICAPVLALAMVLLSNSEMIAPAKPTTSENTSSPPTFKPLASSQRFRPNRLMTMPSTTITARLVITNSMILFMAQASVQTANRMGTVGRN